MGETARSVFSASISLLAGYSFIRFSYYRRFMSEHLRTDRYALHVLGYSFFLFILGEILATTSFVQRYLGAVDSNLVSAGITAPVINAIVIGIAWGVLDNFRVLWLMRKSGAMIGRTGRQSASWIENLLEGLRIAAATRFVTKSKDSALRAIFRATLLKKPVMVTLKSHKVYVGKPYLTIWDDPTEALTFIKILPTRSGYRDPNTKKVQLSTRYDKLSEQLVELGDGRKQTDATDVLGSDMLGLTNVAGKVIAEIDIEDLGVVIAWDEVESLTIYDQNLFDAFQRQGPGTAAG
jgi:hypothetical protein